MRVSGRLGRPDDTSTAARKAFGVYVRSAHLSTYRPQEGRGGVLSFSVVMFPLYRVGVAVEPHAGMLRCGSHRGAAGEERKPPHSRTTLRMLT